MGWLETFMKKAIQDPMDFIYRVGKKTVKGVKEAWEESNSSPIQSISTLTSTEARQIIKDEYAPKVTEIRLYDSKYWLYKQNDIVKWISTDDTPNISYVAESHDCDDFVIVMLAKLRTKFPGICAGEVLVSWDDSSGWHAHDVIGYIDETKKFKYLEPQTGAIFDRPGNWNRDWVRI